MDYKVVSFTGFLSDKRLATDFTNYFYSSEFKKETLWCGFTEQFELATDSNNSMHIMSVRITEFYTAVLLQMKLTSIHLSIIIIVQIASVNLCAWIKG